MHYWEKTQSNITHLKAIHTQNPMHKRSQVSMEYVIILSFALIIIIPVTVIAYQVYNDNRDTIIIRQAEQAATNLVREAESIYYLGPPSHSTIEVYIPNGVEQIIADGPEITLRVATNRGIEHVSMPSRVDIQGSLAPTQGMRRFKIEATGTTILIVG